MIQILGLRDYTDSKGKIKTTTKFFENKWRASSVEDLFNNLDKHIEQIPEEERYNMHLTLASCDENADAARVFKFQNIIGIDIDSMDLKNKDQVIEIVLRTLDLEYSKTGISCSGNGLHFFIRLDETIENKDYFKKNFEHYEEICCKIDAELVKAGLAGACDTQMFQASRTMRLPNTLNKKKNKPDTQAYIINSTIEPQGFNLQKASGILTKDSGKTVNPEAVSKISRNLDESGVLKGCDFLKHCYANQSTISEPVWHGMIGVLAALPKGKELVHAYSKKHKDYTLEETDRKYRQARNLTGPRKCESINKLWGKCSGCKHFNKIKQGCPVFIEGDTFIATKATGFYKIVIGANGVPKEQPCYEDLEKFLRTKYEMCFSGGRTYIYKDNFWNEVEEIGAGAKGLFLRDFAHKHFKAHSKAIRQNFQSHIEDQAKYNKPEEFFNEKIQGKLNLQNGVYDMRTHKLAPHSSDYGFRSIMPYPYNADALCPEFDNFLDAISCGRSDVQTLLLEFAGYSLSNDEYRIHKALFLFGYGANGKSTFLELLTSLAGENNSSSLSLSALKDPTNRSMLVGKSFNIGEETNSNALSKSEQFKILTSGGMFEYHIFYKGKFRTQNRAKMLFACNALPYSYDSSHGLFRRLLPVPFEADFTDKEDHHIINKLKEERSGILNKMIDAYNEVKLRGDKFTEPECMKELLDEFEQDTDSLRTWWEDVVIEEPQAETDIKTLFENYKSYCKANELPILYKKQNGFTRVFLNSYKLQKVKRNKKIAGKVKTSYVVVGLKVGSQYD